MTIFAQEGQAGGDHRRGQFLAGRDAQALVVVIGAMALFGGVEVVGDGIEHHARHKLAFALQPDGDGEVRNAVHEVGGAVDRIDDEAVGGIGALQHAAFLAQETVAGAGP